MPSEKLEKSSKIVMQNIIMESDKPQNDSQQELVRDSEESGEPNEKTLKDVKFREWVAVFILCFVNLINYMDRFTIAGVLTDIQDYFQITNDKAGLLQTAFIVFYMICGPLFGYLGDRYSRKWIMAGGVFLWSLTTLCGSFMTKFWWFMLFRALVGVGEASYSTIAPTIISDLFVSDVRSKMLALFYFAIPVGSGMGYIVGSETAKALGEWQWSLRVTPGLGLLAVILIMFFLDDPERGQSEGSGHMENTPWKEDIKDIIRNRSFMFSSAGFTCVAFVAGALAWWGPSFIELGLKLQVDGSVDSDRTSFIFGLTMMVAGIVGLSVGSALSQTLKPRFPFIDPIVCGAGLIVSAPLLFCSTYAVSKNTVLCYVLLFFGQVTLNLNWAIVGDILLYVVLPTRRSTAAGFQLLISHLFGDAGSPYLIGVLSEAFKKMISSSEDLQAGTDADLINFKSLQYALFLTCFVEVIGGMFFLITGFYVLQDKHKVEAAVQAGNSQHLLVNNSDSDQEQTIS